MTETQEIGLFEAIYSQRQITRYRPDPVPEDALKKIVEAATKAPNASNEQPWEFIVITDRGLIGQVGVLYRAAWLERVGAVPPPDESPVHQAARYLAHHMPEVPAMILACVDRNRRRALSTAGIWLAVQNLFLAARALGLGTRLTTVHRNKEDEIKALLKIPDHIDTVTLIPVGYPRGSFGPNSRRPANEVTSFNFYGNRAEANGTAVSGSESDTPEQQRTLSE